MVVNSQMDVREGLSYSLTFDAFDACEEFWKYTMSDQNSLGWTISITQIEETYLLEMKGTPLNG